MLPTVNPGGRSFGSVEYHDVHTCKYVYHIAPLNHTEAGTIFGSLAWQARPIYIALFFHLCNLSSKQKKGELSLPPRILDYNGPTAKTLQCIQEYYASTCNVSARCTAARVPRFIPHSDFS